MEGLLNLDEIKNIAIEIKNATIQLYDIYMKKWNCDNSDKFDKSINKFRKIVNKYYKDDKDMNKVLIDIPYSFSRNNNNYWESIINKSNRYFPGIEDHQRFKEDERYIQELIPSIIQFLQIKDSNQLCDEKTYNKLSILIFAYNIRDYFINWINMLNLYEKIHEYSEYKSIDEMIESTFEHMMNAEVKKFELSHKCKNLYKIYKCLASIIKVWYCIKKIPAINNLESIITLSIYFTNLNNDETFIKGYKLIKLLNSRSTLFNNLINHTTNINYINNMQLQLQNIQDNIDNQSCLLNDTKTPRPFTYSDYIINNLLTPRNNILSPRKK